MLETLKGFKTVAFGAAVAILGVLETLNITDFAQFIPDQYEPLLVSVIGTLVVVLRFFTNSPALKK
jgi:hypothetical protein